MIGKILSRDMRFTFKSCAGIVIIGATVAGAMVVIRLVGERRLLRFLDALLVFVRRSKREKLAGQAYAPDNLP